MKLNQLKKIIREELKNLNEQRGMTDVTGAPVSPTRPGRPNVSPVGGGNITNPIGQQIVQMFDPGRPPVGGQARFLQALFDWLCDKETPGTTYHWGVVGTPCR